MVIKATGAIHSSNSPKNASFQGRMPALYWSSFDPLIIKPSSRKTNNEPRSTQSCGWIFCFQTHFIFENPVQYPAESRISKGKADAYFVESSATLSKFWFNARERSRSLIIPNDMLNYKVPPSVVPFGICQKKYWAMIPKMGAKLQCLNLSRGNWIWLPEQQQQN